MHHIGWDEFSYGDFLETQKWENFKVWLSCKDALGRKRAVQDKNKGI